MLYALSSKIAAFVGLDNPPPPPSISPEKQFEADCIEIIRNKKDIDKLSFNHNNVSSSILKALIETDQLETVNRNKGFKYAVFANQNLNDFILLELDLEGARFTNTSLERTNLSGANLQNVTIEGGRAGEKISAENVNFTGATFTNTKILDMNLNGANFNRSTIKSLTFKAVCIQEGIKLDGVKGGKKDGVNTIPICFQGINDTSIKVREMFLESALQENNNEGNNLVKKTSEEIYASLTYRNASLEYKQFITERSSHVESQQAYLLYDLLEGRPLEEIEQTLLYEKTPNEFKLLVNDVAAGKNFKEIEKTSYYLNVCNLIKEIIQDHYNGATEKRAKLLKKAAIDGEIIKTLQKTLHYQHASVEFKQLIKDVIEREPFDRIKKSHYYLNIPAEFKQIIQDHYAPLRLPTPSTKAHHVIKPPSNIIIN
jgi:uncharacterized protein YjbI with pentapeptide repeats